MGNNYTKFDLLLPYTQGDHKKGIHVAYRASTYCAVCMRAIKRSTTVKRVDNVSDDMFHDFMEYHSYNVNTHVHVVREVNLHCGNSIFECIDCSTLTCVGSGWCGHKLNIPVAPEFFSDRLLHCNGIKIPNDDLDKRMFDQELHFSMVRGRREYEKSDQYKQYVKNRIDRSEKEERRIGKILKTKQWLSNVTPTIG